MRKQQKSGTASIRELLARIGLEEREIEIYLALLPVRIARASAIAKAARQPRTLTYIVLRELEEKGLVSRIKRGNVLHFVAEPPQRLLSYAHDRRSEMAEVEKLIEGSLPFLASLTSPYAGEPRVTLLHGMEGVKQVYRDLLAKPFLGVFNAKAMYDALGTSAPELIFGKERTLEGRDLVVDNKEARQYIAANPSTEKYEVRLLPKHINFLCDSLIYGDTIAVFAYDEENTIVRIENKNIADYFRMWFEVLWNVSRKPDQ